MSNSDSGAKDSQQPPLNLRATRSHRQFVVVENLDNTQSISRNSGSQNQNNNKSSVDAAMANISGANNNLQTPQALGGHLSPREERGVSFCDTISSSKSSCRGSSSNASAHSLILDDCSSSDAGTSSN